MNLMQYHYLIKMGSKGTSDHGTSIGEWNCKHEKTKACFIYRGAAPILQLRCDPRGRCCFGPRGPQLKLKTICLRVDVFGNPHKVE